MDGSIASGLGGALGTGNFTADSELTAETSSTYGVQLGDLNGDGVLDIVSGGVGNYDGIATIRVARTINGVSPLLPFSLLTQTGGLQALAPLEQKLNQISSQRSTVGAFQSRISAATKTLNSIVENYKAADSRISDADIASDSADLIRLTILQDAASAILARANQNLALSLTLLEP